MVIMRLQHIYHFSTHRSRKRKQEDESNDEDDVDIDKKDDYISYDDEHLQSDAESSDDEDDYIDGKEDNRVVPSIRGTWEWKRGELSSYQSVDGSMIFDTYGWRGEDVTTLSWDANVVITTGQKALVSNQRKRSITLERVFGRSSKLSQVPYRKLEYSCY